MDPLFHIVMHEPEIPNNTGNIGRTCITTGCSLHLIHPLGFDTSETACRRAGLDYWPRLKVTEHGGWDEYRDATQVEDGQIWLFSTKAERTVWDVEFRPGDHMVFGKETAGLPEEMLADLEPRTVRFPMAPGERSLNVATVVCTAIYEGLRQLHARGEITLDDEGRIQPSL